MVTVVLVALPDALNSCLASWEDLFVYANQLAQRRGGAQIFSTQRWTPGSPVPRRPDVVLVPARVVGAQEGRIPNPTPPEVAPLLVRWHTEGTLIGAVCAGVFPVAEAGILDGARATTHWSLADEFRRRYPRVILDSDALVVETSTTLIGGGMTAYFDVGLRLIRRFGGPDVAHDCASVFVLDPERRLQTPFSPAGFDSTERDPVLAGALAWLHNQPTLRLGVAEWATAVAVERRTLERRARVAWGVGPAEKLRRLKLDRARLLVLGGTLTWEQISDRCGYQDAAAFRRLFLERFGQTPGEYRRRFGPG